MSAAGMSVSTTSDPSAGQSMVSPTMPQGPGGLGAPDSLQSSTVAAQGNLGGVSRQQWLHNVTADLPAAGLMLTRFGSSL